MFKIKNNAQKYSKNLAETTDVIVEKATELNDVAKEKFMTPKNLQE